MLNRSPLRPAAANVCVNRPDGQRGLASLLERDSPTMMKTAAILVVDGDTSALASLVEPLRKAGYRTVGADSFETGRRLLHTEWFDLLITDIRLAAYNGLHLVFHSRVLNPACNAIVLASVPDASIETETRRFGAHYVAGAVEPDSLLALVGTVLEGQGAQQRPQDPSQASPGRP
jgi:DNA-binding NtrC family response regulator